MWRPIMLASLIACSTTTPITVAAPTEVSPPVVLEASKSQVTRRFPIVDFDGDGLGDLAFTAVEQPGDVCRTHQGRQICTQSNDPARMTVLVFLGRDRGALSQTVELSSGPDDLKMGRGYELGVVGDLDGDGRSEVAITYHPYPHDAEQLLLLRGTERGLSAPYQSIALPKLTWGFWYSVRARPAGDLDGDGHPDVLLGTAFLRGGPTGKLHGLELVRSPGMPAHAFVPTYPVGDVTGDGRADLLTVHDRKLHLLPGGDPAAAISQPLSSTNQALEVADLDGDGKAELITVTAGAPLRLATYTLSIAGATLRETIEIPGDEIHGLAAADTDGSGRRDLHVITSLGRADVPCAMKCTGPSDVHVRTVRDTPHGLVLEPRVVDPGRLIFGAGPRIYLRMPGDLDGDGREELAVVEGGTLRAERSRGGTFVLPARYRETPSQIDVYTGPAY